MLVSVRVQKKKEGDKFKSWLAMASQVIFLHTHGMLSLPSVKTAPFSLTN